MPSDYFERREIPKAKGKLEPTLIDAIRGRKKINNLQNEGLGLFRIKRLACNDYETISNDRTKKTQKETNNKANIPPINETNS